MFEETIDENGFVNPKELSIVMHKKVASHQQLVLALIRLLHHVISP